MFFVNSIADLINNFNNLTADTTQSVNNTMYLSPVTHDELVHIIIDVCIYQVMWI